MDYGINFLFMLILATSMNLAGVSKEVKQDQCEPEPIVNIIQEHNILKGTIDTILVIYKEKKVETFKQKHNLIVNDECLSCSIASSGLPYRGSFNLSSSFGMRMHPILKKKRRHNGIDISMPTGTPLLALGKGKVIRVKWNSNGYGLYMDISYSDNNSYIVRYAHLSKVKVKVGDYVSNGQIVAKSGNTGLSTGPHLHLEVHIDGKVVNPINFINVESSTTDVNT